jgi:hypothetical protein
MGLKKKDEKGIKNKPLKLGGRISSFINSFHKRCLKCQDIQAGAACRIELLAEGSKELTINSKD